MITLERRLIEIERLAASGGPAEVRALLELLGDEEWQTRRAVALAIAAVVPALKEVAVRDAAIVDLIAAVSSPVDAPRRAAAIVALEAIGRMALPHLAVALESAAASARTALAGVIGGAGGGGAVSLLEPLCREADRNVAAAATLALGRTRSSEALPFLLARLDEGDEWLTVAACGALGELGDGRAVGRLAKLLDDPLLRDTAITSLVEIGTVDAAEVLRARVWDPIDFAVVPDVLAALVSVAGQAGSLPPDLAATIREITRTALPDTARDSLVGMLSELPDAGEAGSVNACLTAAGWMGELQVLPLLGSMMRDCAFSQAAREVLVTLAATDEGVAQILSLTPDAIPAIDAAQILAEVRSAPAYEGLLQILNATGGEETSETCLQALTANADWLDANVGDLPLDARVRIEVAWRTVISANPAKAPVEAARALGSAARSWDSYAIDQVGAELLGNRTEAAVIAALTFHSQCAPDFAQAEAINALKHPAARVRVTAIETIARPAGRVSGITLTKHLSDESAAVRRAAARALREIELGGDSRRALTASLIDDDIWVRFEAIGTLAVRWGREPEVVERLGEELYATHPICRVAAIEAQAKIATRDWTKLQDLAAHDQHAEVRMAALRHIAAHPRRSLAAAELNRSLDDPDWPVRLAAIELAILQNQRGLADRLTDITINRGETPAVRALAIRALAEWSHPSAVRLAVDALDDPAAAVVEAAFVALKQLSATRSSELEAHYLHCPPRAANHLHFILRTAAESNTPLFDPRESAVEMGVAEQA